MPTRFADLLKGGLLALFAGLLPPFGAAAQAIDPHAVYEQKCALCHAPHSGQFVHDSLGFSEGRLTGLRSGQPVASYFDRGHGNLTPAEAAVLLEHLTRISGWGSLFHEKCDICHDPAVQLARKKLILRDGVLMGRYTGRVIADFLTWHGRLTAPEIAPMLDMLIWQLETDARLR